MSFEQIRYSMVWEDPESLKLGLNIRQDDDVLCIASAGCNVFALALEKPRRIVALDLSPAQICLLKLKISAIGLLDYDDFICLIGLSDSTGERRLEQYLRVKTNLDERTQQFWDARADVIQSGISSAGRLDLYFKKFREEKLVNFINHEIVTQLIQSSTLEEQGEVFSRVNLAGLKYEIFQFFGQEPLARFARDPAQFRFVDKADLQSEVWRRFVDVFTRTRVRDNYFLRYFLTGEYPTAEKKASPYLLEANYPALRGAVKQIEISEIDLETFLQQDAQGKFSKIALSDVFEYMSEEHADRVFALLGRAMRPGGRVAYWNLFVNRQAKLNSGLTELSELSTQLSAKDLLWLYQNFNVYEKVDP